VIESRITTQVIQRTARTVFVTTSAEHDTANASIHHEASAHRARFKRDHHRGVLESPRTNSRGRIANRQKFRVRSGILRLFALVMTPSNDLAIDHNDGTDRNFTLLASESRLFKR
jgi:hypothetical protein